MRKLLSAFAVVCLMAGVMVAAEGTIAKVDLEKKEIVVKEGDKENTYKFTDKVKVTLTSKDKDGNEKSVEGKYEDFEKRLKAFKPDDKKGGRLVFEAKDGELTEVKLRTRGGKN